MADQEQLELLKQGVGVWNDWRAQNTQVDLAYNEHDVVRIDLRKADLTEIDLGGANLSRADLREADLSEGYLYKANLQGADLTGADLRVTYAIKANFFGADLVRADLKLAEFTGANLHLADMRQSNLEWADFVGADLREAQLMGANLVIARLSQANLSNADLSDANLASARLAEANLTGAKLIRSNLRSADLSKSNLSGANLEGADLSQARLGAANLCRADLREAILVGTNVEKARISGSSIYGVNVWDLQGELEEQKDLIITLPKQAAITVDNIKVAQFIYLILNNEEVRSVINTLTSKSVLILGRFTLPERKAVLDALRNKLREYNLLPIVFDFERPTDKDFTETIKTLASLSYFVIADVTNPKSSPLELQATVPDYQIPFVPIIQEGENPFAMMVDLQKKYNWVLNTVSYDSQETLMKVLKPLIIDPAMQKRQELRLIKAQEPEIISARDFLSKGQA